jgi:hypothetical protein
MMKHPKLSYLLIVISLKLAFSQAFVQAENHGGHRAYKLDREHQADRAMDNDHEKYKDGFNDNMGGTIYGARLMTEQERNRYREQLKNATSEQQRNEIRLQHQKEMQLREQMNSKYKQKKER